MCVCVCTLRYMYVYFIISVIYYIYKNIFNGEGGDSSEICARITNGHVVD